MHSRDHLVLERVDRFVGEYLDRAVVADRAPLHVSAWQVPDKGDLPGEPVSVERMRQDAAFAPVEGGHRWGRAWGTTWFTVEGEVPRSWAERDGRIELSLDLGFSQAKPGFQCEGLVRTLEGVVVKGLEPRNHHVPVSNRPGERVSFTVEAAANPDLSGGDDFKSPLAFSPTPLGDPATAGAEPLYRLGRMELRLVDETVERLRREIIVLVGLARELVDSDPRRARILDGLERALYVIDPDAPAEGAAAASGILAPLLAAPAAASAHRITATGHAHIDSAWLWPSRETVRKVTRTYANVLDLMDADPDAVFVSSSAQHFEWVRRSDPELFARIKERVAEGRFLPVGNMWVESDVNMPSGESLARQLLAGTRFFEEHFGARSDVGWLPDSFGFPAGLPQLLRGAGLEWFFTQKMCWNDVDTMPHHSFVWEGLDGSRIFTHFPPNNTYSGDMRPTELARSVRNFADHAASTRSLMPFGFGDGGGGPTREMMADARLQADLEGSPTIAFGTPREFFLEAAAEPTDPPVWSGEMYLQFHRGIFTSQMRTKRGNRRNEALLVEAEHWSAAATVRRGIPYPAAELDELWREVLLLQFHDILPGSAIAWVHREAERSHAETTDRLERIIADAVAALVGEGSQPLALNPGTAPVAAIAAGGAGAAPAPVPVTAENVDGGFRLRSDQIDVRVGPDGTLRSVVELATGRDLIPAGHRGGLLQLHVDAPSKWDAWELDASYRLATTDVDGGTAELVDGVVHVVHPLPNGTAEQWIDIHPDGGGVRIRTRVDWHERHRLLKLAFPVAVHAQDAAYETQFGHVRRPLHTNTSWDAARYEVCAHRWVHVGEPGTGAAIVNDGMYGHDATRTSDEDGTVTTVRQSLLRAPTFPDPDADQGVHEFTSLFAPAETTTDAARWGAIVGSPLREVTGAAPVAPLVTSSTDGIVVSAVKLAADGSGDLIVRAFEQRGARTGGTLHLDVPSSSLEVCDLVETVGRGRADAARRTDDRTVALDLRAFEVVTLRIALHEPEQS
ncbi:glycoside hydrolase family 38 C-terminal domain-containing protein [Microbacterium sp. 77mftsu3.1]|uniref:alpha-mannosidase n=1 Tax=Microbacterium sp. 77mftsu3.1 TaxID=1761802 RepID=UPI00035E1D5B|nr:glycoside hydrolase family 38 C-terminal domain-containing protein [Microbacterium sp. 77mftsu3.1]SDG65588.1 alpha-mannosidase [Microbacterium sp. 77mftsu3.1]